MQECEEPGCRYPATESYDGLRLCFNCMEVRMLRKRQERSPECSEAGCRQPVTRDFGGKRLCQDCWERYKAHKQRVETELKALR